MIVLPQNFLSLISFVLALFFIQSGFFFLFFYYKVNRLLEYSTREHLYFATMSWGQALYCIGAWQIYSTKLASDSTYWQQVQWFAGIIMFACFILFTSEYLNLKIKWFRRIILLPSLVFAYEALYDSSFLTGPPDLKTFTILGNSYQIYEMDMGPIAKVASFWMILFTLILLFIWFFYLTQQRTKLRAAAIGIIFLILAGFNELFVSLRYYKSPYVLEYGFFLFSVCFYIQLFSDFFNLYRENILKAEELEKLNEESRFFINRVAHDLRAPLLSIDGFLNLFSKESKNFNASQKDYFERIQRNTTHMNKLLDDLKALIQIGFLPEAKEFFDLKKSVQEMIESFEVRLKKFEVKVEISEDLPAVFFVKRRFVDVMSNLLDNAIKYGSDSKTPLLEIRAQMKESKIEVSVQDNGKGVASEHQDKIFELFYRGQDEQAGSGIGLATVKKILENFGEKIWLESEVKHFTRFVFTLSIVN